MKQNLRPWLTVRIVLLLVLVVPFPRLAAWPWPFPPASVEDPDPELRFRLPLSPPQESAPAPEMDSLAREQARIDPAIPYGMQPVGPVLVYRMPDGLNLVLEFPQTPGDPARVRVSDADGERRYAASRFFSSAPEPEAATPGSVPQALPGLRVGMPLLSLSGEIVRAIDSSVGSESAQEPGGTGGQAGAEPMVERVERELVLPAPGGVARAVDWYADWLLLAVPAQSAAGIHLLRLEIQPDTGETVIYSWDFRAAPADPAMLDAGSLPSLLRGVRLGTPPGTEIRFRLHMRDVSGGQWDTEFILNRSP